MREAIRRLITSPSILSVVVLGTLLTADLSQLIKASQYVFFRGDNTYPESAVVQTAIWARDSGRIYPNLDLAPYTPAPYGPLFYVAFAAIAEMTGADFDTLLVLGRALVLACFLLLAVLVFFWVRRQQLPVPVALVTASLILAQIDFLEWNVSVRPDLIALLLTFLGFWAISDQQISWRHAAAAGICCALAAVTKQSFIALPAAISLWLLWTRRIRDLAVFAVSGIIVGTLLFAWLSWRHEPFLQQMLLASHSMLSVTSAVALLKADFLHYPLQLVLLSFGLLGLLFRNRLTLLISIYFVLSWALGFYTAMAPGANVNAFLEAWVITSAAAAFTFTALWEEWSSIPTSAAAIVLLLWISNMLVSIDVWRVLVTMHTPREYEVLAEAFRGQRLLADVPYIAVHGRDPELLDPSVNHYLELAGRWSAKPVLQELEKQEFDYVVIGINDGHIRQWRGLTLFSGSILQGIDQSYRLLCISDRIAIYVPRYRSVGNGETLKNGLEQSGCRRPPSPTLALPPR